CRGRLQGVRTGVARRVRSRRPAGQDAPEHQGAAVIALIDYGAGNLTSVRKALSAVGVDFIVPDSPADCSAAAGVIVPGVGNFAATTAITPEWRTAINAAVDAGT